MVKKIKQKLSAIFTLFFLMSSFLNFQISYSQAAMVGPDSGTVNITGQIKDVTTTNPVAGAAVKLLLREPISYYQWYDYENNIWMNDCVEPLVQKDNRCYTELQIDITDNNGNYLLENTNACNFNFDRDYYFDLEFSKENYITKTIEDINEICGETVIKNTLLAPNDSTPDWRRDIQPGDILYDPYTSGIGHTGLYVGDGRVIEAQGNAADRSYEKNKVNDNPISLWDYPSRKDAYILRIKNKNGLSEEAMSLIKNNAIEFALQQVYPVAKPYDWSWYQKQSDIDSPSWYCSELVWAAYINQGIDLEYSHDPLGIISPVSPDEIFMDDDVEVINSHLSTELNTWRDYVFLFVFSPVEITVTDEDGNVFDKNNIGGIPGALYLEDEVDANGQVRDRIILPNGNYKITVTPKPGANPNDTYSLMMESGGQQTYLAQDVKLSDIPNEPYVIDENEATVGGFSDTEEISGNLYQAGTLDAVFLSANNFSPTTTPSQIAAATASAQNNGTLDFQYKISAENFSGGIDLCAALNFQAKRNGTEIYNSALTNFFVATSTLETLAADNFDFIASLSAGADASLQNKTCFFDLELKSWQTGSDDENAGFNDEEILSFSISSGEWSASPPAPAGVVLNEFLPNPQGFEYNFDFGSDSDSMPKGEWVELYNNDNIEHNLTDWYIKDAANHKIDITNVNTNLATTTISAHGWLVVYMNNAILNNSEDTITLYDNNDTIKDSYYYKGRDFLDLEPTPGGENTTSTSGTSSISDVPDNKSFARIPDGAGDWVDPIPTPGGPNKIEETQDIITPVSAQSAAGESELENEETIEENNNPSEQILEQADEPEEIIEPIVYEPVGDTIQNPNSEDTLPIENPVETPAGISVEEPQPAAGEEIAALPAEESATAVESPAPVSESTIVE